MSFSLILTYASIVIYNHLEILLFLVICRCKIWKVFGMFKHFDVKSQRSEFRPKIPKISSVHFDRWFLISHWRSKSDWYELPALDWILIEILGISTKRSALLHCASLGETVIKLERFLDFYVDINIRDFVIKRTRGL